MITNSEVQVAVCFLIALMLMMVMSFWCVRIRRTAMFIASSWLCFVLISGSGYYLACASLDFPEETNPSENVNLLAPSPDRKSMVPGTEETTSVAFAHVVPAAEQVFPTWNGSAISRFAPVALFQILLALFFIGLYFAVKNDLFRDHISVVKEQLNDTTRRWMREKGKSSQDRKMNRTILNNISHEIRTPLNAILGLSQVIQMQRQKSDELCEVVLHEQTVPAHDVDDEIFETIRKNGADLIFVVENMILFSSIDSNLVKIHYSEIDFFDFLRDLKLEIRKKTLWDESKQPGSQVIVQRNFPTKLVSDPYCLRSILLNVWENAIKFSDATNVYVRFAIRPENENLFPSSQLPEDFPDRKQRFSPAVFAVEVSDSGIGIPKDHIEDIFQPFYQAQTGSTRNYNGLGLGLTITKQLTQMLGGEVSVKSEPGKGSRFTLEFPTWIEAVS